MATAAERRESFRFPFEAGASIIIERDTDRDESGALNIVQGRIVNISMTGVRFICKTHLDSRFVFVGPNVRNESSTRMPRFEIVNTRELEDGEWEYGGRVVSNESDADSPMNAF